MLHLWIEVCQYRSMSKQELPIVPRACCAPQLDEDQAVELAAVFKALGDPIRLRLVSMIAKAEPGTGICVCELTPGFDVSQPTVSHHLKLLRQAGLVGCERRGTWVYYWLLPEQAGRVATFLAGIRPDVNHETAVPFPS
jgi:ArsR family transcriptional regulator, arsenate/arsenite/antimonite-responsive transcriptional repressor